MNLIITCSSNSAVSPVRTYVPVSLKMHYIYSVHVKNHYTLYIERTVFFEVISDFGVSRLFKEITCTHSRGHKITSFGRRDFNKKIGSSRSGQYCKNNLFLKKKTKMTKKSNFEILGCCIFNILAILPQF